MLGQLLEFDILDPVSSHSKCLVCKKNKIFCQQCNQSGNFKTHRIRFKRSECDVRATVGCARIRTLQRTSNHRQTFGSLHQDSDSESEQRNFQRKNFQSFETQRTELSLSFSIDRKRAEFGRAQIHQNVFIFSSKFGNELVRSAESWLLETPSS